MYELKKWMDPPTWSSVMFFSPSIMDKECFMPRPITMMSRRRPRSKAVRPMLGFKAQPGHIDETTPATCIEPAEGINWSYADKRAITAKLVSMRRNQCNVPARVAPSNSDQVIVLKHTWNKDSLFRTLRGYPVIITHYLSLTDPELLKKRGVTPSHDIV